MKQSYEMMCGFFSVYVVKSVYLAVLFRYIPVSEWLGLFYWLILFFSFHFLMGKWYKLLRAGVFPGYSNQSET